MTVSQIKDKLYYIARIFGVFPRYSRHRQFSVSQAARECLLTKEISDNKEVNTEIKIYFEEKYTYCFKNDNDQLEDWYNG